MKPLLGSILLLTTFASANDLPRRIPENVLFSSYRITVLRDDKAVDVGSCVAIDKHRVITADHVVTKDKVTIQIDLFDNDGIYQRSIPCKIVREDEDADLALLETQEDLPQSQPLDYGSVKVGELTYSIGAAWGDAPYSIATGNLAAKCNSAFQSLWQMSATIVPGMSGGGVYSADHKFIGIMVRGAPSAGGLFVPADTVKNFLKKDAKDDK